MTGNGKQSKEEIYEEKRKVARLFRSKCFICHKKFGAGFTYHHKWYTEGGTTWRDTDYHRRIYEEIRANPKQFLCLCTKCHYALERLKRYGDKKFERLIRTVRMSR